MQLQTSELDGDRRLLARQRTPLLCTYGLLILGKVLLLPRKPLSLSDIDRDRIQLLIVGSELRCQLVTPETKLTLKRFAGGSVMLGNRMIREYCVLSVRLAQQSDCDEVLRLR